MTFLKYIFLYFNENTKTVLKNIFKIKLFNDFDFKFKFSGLYLNYYIH